MSSLSKARAGAIVGLLAALGAILFGFLGMGAVAGVCGIVGLIGAALGLMFLQKVDAALNTARRVSEKVAKGDFEARITFITETGNLGETLWSINNLIDHTDAFLRESAASMQSVSENKYFRRIIETGASGAFRHAGGVINAATGAMESKVRQFREVADSFETTIQNVVETVASAASELQATSESMETTAAATADRALTVANAAEQTSESVQAVAAAAEQLNASIREISQQVGLSSQATHEAVDAADKTKNDMYALEEASTSIGKVLSLIDDIAAQTNLLALNATVEAARAGEAGKGFAVVAAEVKNLSDQTAKATDQVGSQVTNVQQASTEAVRSIETISKTIDHVNSAASTIAAAVEEQGAATGEIARSVDHASSGTQEVTSHIREVTEAANETGSAAAEVLEAARELARQAERMRGEVSEFLLEIRKVA
ncbi:MAG: methyl-accepting chemotaxis protein [Magnetospiraceae bacterium]